jgi:uncharacterized protein (TIGR00251 family)
LRARGNGDLRRKESNLTTESQRHRENQPNRVRFPLCLCASVVRHMFAFHETSGGVTFAVKIHPRARKNAITGELGNALKISLTSPPVEGRANEACIEFFANLLKVPRSSVTIASGQSSRQKVIRISGLSAEELRRRIAR